MSTPTIAASSRGLIATTTSHSIALPSAVSSGDLLVAHVFFESDIGPAIPTPFGWSVLASELPSLGTPGFLLLWRRADGSEGGTSLSLSTGNSTRSAFEVLRVEDANDPELAGEEEDEGGGPGGPGGGGSSGATSGNGTLVASAASWTASNVIAVAFGAFDNSTSAPSVTGYDADYDDHQQSLAANDSPGGWGYGVCAKYDTGSLHDEGSFTLNTSSNWIASNWYATFSGTAPVTVDAVGDGITVNVQVAAPAINTQPVPLSSSNIAATLVAGTPVAGTNPVSFVSADLAVSTTASSPIVAVDPTAIDAQGVVVDVLSSSPSLEVQPVELQASELIGSIVISTPDCTVNAVQLASLNINASVTVPQASAKVESHHDANGLSASSHIDSPSLGTIVHLESVSVALDASLQQPIVASTGDAVALPGVVQPVLSSPVLATEVDAGSGSPTAVSPQIGQGTLNAVSQLAGSGLLISVQVGKPIAASIAVCTAVHVDVDPTAEEADVATIAALVANGITVSANNDTPNLMPVSQLTGAGVSANVAIGAATAGSVSGSSAGDVDIFVVANRPTLTVVAALVGNSIEVLPSAFRPAVMPETHLTSDHISVTVDIGAPDAGGASTSTTDDLELSVSVSRPSLVAIAQLQPSPVVVSTSTAKGDLIACAVASSAQSVDVASEVEMPVVSAIANATARNVTLQVVASSPMMGTNEDLLPSGVNVSVACSEPVLLARVALAADSVEVQASAPADADGGSVTSLTGDAVIVGSTAQAPSSGIDSESNTVPLVGNSLELPSVTIEPTVREYPRFMCCCTCVDGPKATCTQQPVYGTKHGQLCYVIENAVEASYQLFNCNGVLASGDISLSDGGASGCFAVDDAWMDYCGYVTLTVTASNDCETATCSSSAVCEDIPQGDRVRGTCEDWDVSNCQVFDNDVDMVPTAQPAVEVTLTGFTGGLAAFNGVYVVGCNTSLDLETSCYEDAGGYCMVFGWLVAPFRKGYLSITYFPPGSRRDSALIQVVITVRGWAGAITECERNAQGGNIAVSRTVSFTDAGRKVFFRTSNCSPSTVTTAECAAESPPEGFDSYTSHLVKNLQLLEDHYPHDGFWCGDLPDSGSVSAGVQ